MHSPDCVNRNISSLMNTVSIGIIWQSCQSWVTGPSDKAEFGQCPKLHFGWQVEADIFFFWEFVFIVPVQRHATVMRSS